MYILLSFHVLTTFCVMIQLTTILHGNYSDVSLICTNVSISMEINDSLQIFKDSISRQFLELTIVSKSWIL